MGNLFIIKVALSDDHVMDIAGQANLGNLRICDMGRSPRIWGCAQLFTKQNDPNSLRIFLSISVERLGRLIFDSATVIKVVFVLVTPSVRECGRQRRRGNIS
jgi:hypothetical protein